jgi:hypothetical protein
MDRRVGVLGDYDWIRGMLTKKRRPASRAGGRCGLYLGRTKPQEAATSNHRLGRNDSNGTERVDSEPLI